MIRFIVMIYMVQCRYFPFLLSIVVLQPYSVVCMHISFLVSWDYHQISVNTSFLVMRLTRLALLQTNRLIPWCNPSWTLIFPVGYKLYVHYQELVILSPWYCEFTKISGCCINWFFIHFFFNVWYLVVVNISGYCAFIAVYGLVWYSPAIGIYGKPTWL